MSTATPENSTAAPEPPAVGVPPPAAGSVLGALFKHMSDEHNLTLLDSELSEIVRLVNDHLDTRLRWWIANAEAIAQERGELFRAGEAMRTAYAVHIGTEKSQRLAQWDAAAQPMRDMIAGLSRNIQTQTGGEAPATKGTK